jgi:hypothetical protein
MARHLHVLLSEEQYDFLRVESARTGLPMAELVRRGLDETYEIRRRPKVRGVEFRLGLWRRPDAAAAARWNRVV